MNEGRRLVLHVGGHKTGTSSFQRFLRRDAATLSERGVLLPSLGKDAQGRERSHRILAEGIASGRQRERARARAFLESVAADPGERLTLLTNEEFNRFVAAEDGAHGVEGQRRFVQDYMDGTERYWDRRALFVRRVADLLEPFDVEVWVTLRRPDRFCMSMYQQFVKVRHYVGSARDFAALNHALFDYERQVAQWAEHFDRVRVFVFEDALDRPARMTGALLEALGLSDLEGQAAELGSVNTALHPYVTDLLRFTNHLPLDKAAIREAAKARLDRSGWPPVRALAVLDRETRAAVNDRYRAGCERIGRRFDVPMPGRDTMFDWTIEDDREVFEGLDLDAMEGMLRELALQPQTIGGPSGALAGSS